MPFCRACAAVAVAVVLAFPVQPGIAAPLPADSAHQGPRQLLHLVHGDHEDCVLAHRHRWDGNVVPCLPEGPVVEEDDGGDYDDEPDVDVDVDDEGGCVRIGPMEVCQ